jgi:undecaprenyl phosphate N,N'-diacetylbacillosamine 1-phosphate transferase
MMYRKYIKRLLDFILSLIAIIILLPILVIIATIVRIKLGFPIFFKQDRVGKDEKIFKMYKFRTMADKRDENGNLLPDEQRITPFGSILRSTSLDELPELFNILKGDISIVGPRPLPVEYLQYYTDYEKVRHSVRGGLTIPEVLYGNLTPTWEEQFHYEVLYVRNLSFLLDVKIVVSTIRILFKRVGEDYGNEVRIPLAEERKIYHDL